MSIPLISPDLLQRSNKILFIAHLAIGDYTYLQNCFSLLSRAYPNLRIDLWVDEVRRTSDEKKWDSLKNYVLYDWLNACPWFGKIYNQTYSPDLYRQSIQEALRENYPIVVSLATLRPHKYARLAREICPDGFVAGMKKPLSLFTLHYIFSYSKLNAGIPPYTVSPVSPQHISDIYADWFHQLFGMDIPEGSRFPFIDIPVNWIEDAEKFLKAWGVDRISENLVFINAFAKTKKRSWPLKNIVMLIQAMKKTEEYHNAWFLINAMPENREEINRLITENELDHTRVFSATENFFQLPAILSMCDLIISVETAIMHLANAVHVPVVALMRLKNPEWVPVDSDNSVVITAEKRSEWVKDITVDRVMKEIPR